MRVTITAQLKGKIMSIKMAQRFTGLVEAHERGGFVAVSDYLELRAALETAQEAVINNCARILELDAEIAGWKADQKENLRIQIKQHDVIEAQRKAQERKPPTDDPIDPSKELVLLIKNAKLTADHLRSFDTSTANLIEMMAKELELKSTSFQTLYTAINNLLCHIGYEGSIDADHAFVWDAMCALKAIDGGIYGEQFAPVREG